MLALVVAPVLTGQGAPVMKSDGKKTRSPEISVYLHQDTLAKDHAFATQPNAGRSGETKIDPKEGR